ncbi:MAG: DsbE family thiol:disulfide interchange protein [Gammaproteobacteria bacterium]|nr:DsbE family thiol:disulfide interchange protein [Gammaproteobacteria bacterium]
MKLWLPFGIFVALVALLGIGLTLDPRKVPSPLIGKTMPAFELARLHDTQRTVSDTDIRGQVSVLNVWGTWCAGCRAEHDVLMRLARTGQAPIIGLNWKDDRQLAQQWLRDLGNPYAMTGFDHDGRVAIDWGVYGAPETFIVDAAGVVRYKHIGPLTEEVVADKILPLIKQLKTGA